MTQTRRSWLVLPLLAALAACGSPAPSSSASSSGSTGASSAGAATPAPSAQSGGSAGRTGPVAAARPPKLIVFMAVDGLPLRQVLGYRDQLQPDGFRRFLDRGTWFSNAYYGHGYTVTAAGHSIMLSGAYPQRSGIIGNEWRDPKTGAVVYNTEDTRYRYINHETDPHAGTSPANFKAETVGDVLRTVRPGAKVIGISGKDRGAILPAGHKGTAYMYMSSDGQFASTTYYMDRHPAWVDAFNNTRPADAFFHKSWTLLLPESAYSRSAPDGQPWQSNEGNGNRLPAMMGAGLDKPGPKFYAGLLPSPFGDELTLAFARAAIEGEQLGADDQTDILSVSLSSHDYVNHAFGPESRLSHDHLLRLDQYLQGFFQYLDARVGRDNYLLALTADHGFMDTPEWAQRQGREAGRVNPAQLIASLNKGLSERFGEGRWITSFSATGLLFDEKLIQSKGLRSDDVYAAAKVLAEQVPGIQAAFTRAQLAGDDTATPYLAQMRRSWHPDVAAPLQLVPRQGYMFSSRTTGTTHGSPYEYDNHVPLLTWGPAWVGQGEVTARVEIVDLAPTLSRILGIATPAQSQGQVLPLPLPGGATAAPPVAR
ncbi:alkaline phosphatase family protein [Roseateles depolymerans]|uniref:Putative AP superfamily protein n=1 Tax=Roseateles depolymerans TaxID=76731 RepID=A0A0U3C7V0_9BURK|nr:alkaline phosphatase family protein [Roseateles depolymerans]ALV04856.1 Putative AP superfamily protein [Roseateles depolymerans]REG15132.1 type I phosphodiesterase/nucleotide pyrophosphatase [Roseateles depolymerans]